MGESQWGGAVVECPLGGAVEECPLGGAVGESVGWGRGGVSVGWDNGGDPSHSASSIANIAPFSTPPFTAQFPPGPHHHLPGTESVEEFFLLSCGENSFQTLADQCNLYARQQPPGYHTTGLTPPRVR